MSDPRTSSQCNSRPGRRLARRHSGRPDKTGPRLLHLPAAAEALIEAIAGVFTRPTLRRFVLLMGALIVTMGRRTVSHALVLIEPLMRGHWSDYHRIYSAAMWELAAALVREVIKLLPGDVVIELVADDTRA